MPFVKEYFWMMISLSYAHHLAIQRLILRNTGSCSTLSMAFAAVLVTGMTKLMRFSFPLESLPLLETGASTRA